jgi:hypothetical protein
MFSNYCIFRSHQQKMDLDEYFTFTFMFLIQKEAFIYNFEPELNFKFASCRIFHTNRVRLSRVPIVAGPKTPWAPKQLQY